MDRWPVAYCNDRIDEKAAMLSKPEFLANQSQREGSFNAPFIEVRNLYAAYGDNVVVRNLSLSVGAGEHLSLLGPSGCGKSTLLRCIAGLEEPISGEIVIDGKTVFSSERKVNIPPQKRSLAMVFQSYAIWPHMTVCENVAYGLRVKGIGREEARQAAKRTLAMVGMESFIDRPATDLSGGQQQRVAFARSLAPSPKAILLDEPLSNLDARLRANMRNELKDLQTKLRLCTVYVTHDQEEAMAMSDRIIVMRSGEIEQQGTPLEIYRRPRTRFVADFIGASNIAEGRLMTVEGSNATVEVGDILVQCRVADASSAPQVGVECEVAIRRIFPRLSAQETPGLVNQWPATVVARTFLGDSVEYVVSYPGGQFHIQSTPLTDLAKGDRVFVHVPPEYAVLIGASNGPAEINK
jgi:ABC-type Fe3+/spermidine/putrescine transport system ATPase subunit